MTSSTEQQAQLGTGPLPEYEEWLERLTMTYEAVAHCCAARLSDRTLGERASLQVIGGLIERPRVFRFYGLPFSGRVAHLAELAMVQVKAQAAPGGGQWPELRSQLSELGLEDQRTFVLTCVDGVEDETLASVLACDEPTAHRRRESVIELMQTMCQAILSPIQAASEEMHDE